jgi:polyketide biosynthesis acyl carrier protein
MDQEAILAVLAQTVREVVPEVDGAAIATDRTLRDLGCNSIDRAEIVTLVMERLAVTVPVSHLHSGQDIGTLVALFQRYS